MDSLRAERLKTEYSPEGSQAEVLLIEPNGDQHWFRWLCGRNGAAEIYGDQEMRFYLDERYGAQSVYTPSRHATLA